MPTHDFFISHSIATKELARHIYYNAVANSLSPWYDESLLRLGDHLHGEIERGIEASSGFLLLHCAAAVSSDWVRLEMQHAQSKREREPSFRIFVVKLDDHRLGSDFWTQFLYQSWDHKDEAGSLIKLLCALTGKNTVVEITAASVLSRTPSDVFVNESATLAEHSQNFVLFYLGHLKQLMHALATVGYDPELRDSLRKMLALSMVNAIPSVEGGLIPIRPGVFEIIHANRMRTPPRIAVEGLPDRFSWNAVENNEIFSRIEIRESDTGALVTYPTPLKLSITFDARL